MRDEPDPALVWCPFPDPASARQAAKCLLDERLIACANILPAMETHFVWNDAMDETAQSGAAITEAEETGMLVKTNTNLLDRTIARMAELHPYAQPAILGWRCDAAEVGTRAWLGSI